MKLINYYENSKKTGIYCIRNNVNGKIYIGSTKKSFASRKNRHRLLLNSEKHYNEHLQNAWRYYKEENFSFEVLFLCEQNLCEYYEGEFIKLYSSNIREHGYNIANVSSYKFSYSMSEPHNNEKSNRKKIKSSLNGLESNERGLSKPFKIYDLNGNFIDEYQSAKEYSEKNNVKARSIISTILQNRKLKYKNNIIIFSNDTLTVDDIEYVRNILMFRIELYDLDNNLIKTFDNAKECAEFIGCKDAEVRMCCLGRRSRIKKYKTKYVNYGRKKN